jgi:hypothetical protein
MRYETEMKIENEAGFYTKKDDVFNQKKLGFYL